MLDGTWQILNRQTHQRTPPFEGSVHFLTDDVGAAFWLETDRRYVLTRPDGTAITGGYDYGGELSDGLMIAQKDGKRGFIDQAGRVVIDFQFDNVYAFDDDKWAVFETGAYPNRKSGYIDRHGKVMIPARFDTAFRFDGDTANVILDGANIQIDRSGNRIGPCTGAPWVQVSDHKYRLFKPDGSPLNGQVYDFAQISCGQPTLIVKDSRTSYLRPDGTLLGDTSYPKAFAFYDGVAAVWTDDGKVGIIDSMGHFIVQPVVAGATLISVLDQTVINPGPDHRVLTRKLADALARDAALLTTKPPPRFPPGTCGADGVRIVRDNEGISYIDATGKTFIHGAFDLATCFFGRSGIAWVALPDRRAWCQITKTGQIQTETCQCHQPIIIFEFGGGPKFPGERLDCYAYGLKTVVQTPRDVGQSCAPGLCGPLNPQSLIVPPGAKLIKDAGAEPY